MRKKAILILLVIPFIVAILAFVEARNKIKEVEQDITSIDFAYLDNEGYSLDEGKILLEATRIYDESLPLAEGNDLVWTSSNPSVCEITKVGNNYYLNFLSEGESLITCQNEKGTVSKSFTATVFGSSGGIVLNLKQGFSGQSISSDNFIGLYDIDYSTCAKGADYRRTNRVEPFTINLVNMTTDISDLDVSYSPNIEKVDLKNKTITLLDTGEASITITDPNSKAKAGTLSFEIVDGVNVYNYSDLLMATNFNTKGSLAIVQRVNFESLANYNPKNNALFGNPNNDGFSFSDEVYEFTTTYNHEFIDSWNKQVGGHVSTTIKAGIHITADYYGNGFTLNLHNLCYPSDGENLDVDGKKVSVPVLSPTDLFRGPQIYVSLGYPIVPSSLELDGTNAIYALYGQDNIGVYVDGDNITLNDVHFKNCDFGNNLYNLEYTGTVLELDGKNISVNNSILENGRNIIRSYSSDVSINNCLLQNGMEFLVKAGSNEGEHIEYQDDLGKDIRYSYTFNGKPYSTTLKDFLAKALTPINLLNKDFKADSVLTSAVLVNTSADQFLGQFIGKDSFELPYTKEEIVEFNDIIKEALEALKNDKDLYDTFGNKKYHNTITIKDTLMSGSGISAILLDTMSNGSYLESNVTSLFSLVLGSYIPYFPSHMAYTSYPTKLTLEGDNRFYDYKPLDGLDFSTLLSQDIATLIKVHGGVGEVTVTDDNYLPLRLLLKQEEDIKLIEDTTTYVNLPIMKMGGGPNLSDVVMSGEEFSLNSVSVDPYLYSLDLECEEVPDFNTNVNAKRETMLVVMTRASSCVLGFEPYTFYTIDVTKHPWYKEEPNLALLRQRA